MKKNKITYEEVLDLLKETQYKAPDNWSAISDSLDLSKELKDLPTYKAPELVWEGIEKGLEEEGSDSADSMQSTQSNERTMLKSAGVVILLLLMVIAYLLTTRSEAESEFEYRSEIAEVASTESQDVEIDENLTEVYMYIQANEFIFSDEELEKFNRHLEELKSAIEAIQEMKNNYGQDESVNKLLARVEREKAKLLKEMIAAT